MLCHICQKECKNKTSLSMHLIEHKDFVEDQLNLLFKLKVRGYTNLEIMNYDNFQFGMNWIKINSNRHPEVLNRHLEDLKNELVEKYKQGLSSYDLDKEYKISIHKIREYLKAKLNDNEFKKLSNAIKGKKVSDKLTKPKVIYRKKCRLCNNEFETYRKDKNFCSSFCRHSHIGKVAGKFGGRASAVSQQRRSKNEIHFAELCQEYFKDVKCNKPMFNGWDADVIIEDIKIAVLWNGPWHYKKITKKHSLKQVQNRDEIKKKEIEKCGYKVYVIKDMGSEDREFVQNEFNKFVNELQLN